MSLVAGIDSSTQSCKVIVVDPSTGAIVASGRASHHLSRDQWPPPGGMPQLPVLR